MQDSWIFYVVTNRFLYHNWQNEPNGQGGWNGETRLETRIDGAASQVEVIANADGRLEFLYLSMLFLFSGPDNSGDDLDPGD